MKYGMRQAMRNIKQRNSYKRDVRRESAGKYRNILKPGGRHSEILGL